MMTVKEFKADMERETGEKMSMAAARVLYSQYREHEAEAIAGGRDDVAEAYVVPDHHGYDAHDPNFDLDSTGHVYMLPMEDQEREIEYMSTYDSVRERFAGSEDTCGDEYSEEDLAEMKAAHEEWCSTEGSFSPWYPKLNTASSDLDDIPF